VRVDRTTLAALLLAAWLTGLYGPNATGQSPQQNNSSRSLETPSLPQCYGKPEKTIPCHGQTFDVTIQRSIPGEPAATSTARRVLPQPEDSNNRVKYDVRYSVKPSLIGLKQDETGARNGAIQFEVDARNSKGRLVSLVSQRANLRFTSEEYAEFLKRPFQFFQQVDLPSGKFILRVGILDHVSKKSGQIVEISLTVPGVK
jgi:hypothetical protein